MESSSVRQFWHKISILKAIKGTSQKKIATGKINVLYVMHSYKCTSSKNLNKKEGKIHLLLFKII